MSNADAMRFSFRCVVAIVTLWHVQSAPVNVKTDGQKELLKYAAGNNRQENTAINIASSKAEKQSKDTSVPLGALSSAHDQDAAQLRPIEVQAPHQTDQANRLQSYFNRRRRSIVGGGGFIGDQQRPFVPPQILVEQLPTLTDPKMEEMALLLDEIQYRAGVLQKKGADADISKPMALTAASLDDLQEQPLPFQVLIPMMVDNGGYDIMSELATEPSPEDQLPTMGGVGLDKRSAAARSYTDDYAAYSDDPNGGDYDNEPSYYDEQTESMIPLVVSEDGDDNLDEDDGTTYDRIVRAMEENNHLIDEIQLLTRIKQLADQMRYANNLQ